jgi:hypothetical protein
MKIAVMAATLIVAGGSAYAGAPTCEQAFDHLMEIASKDPDAGTQLAKMSDADKRAMRDEAVKECKAKHYTDATLTCYLSAKDFAEVERCDNKGDDKTATAATPPADSALAHLPAISADGKTLALPGSSNDAGEMISFVDLIPLGKTSGEQFRVHVHTISDDGAASDTEDADIIAKLDQRLNDGKFTPLPSAQLDGNRSLDVDGITVELGGTAAKPTLTVRAGKKALALRKLTPDDVVSSVVIVRPSWVYVEMHDSAYEGIGPSKWIALKVALPKPASK